MNQPVNPPVHSPQQPAPSYQTGRRGVHVLTAVINFVSSFLVVAFFFVVYGPGLLSTTGGALGWSAGVRALVSFLVVVALGGAVVGLSYVGWKHRFYELSTDELTVGAGWLIRSRRTARLDRVQAVDVNRGPLARIFGLAELKVEAAGGLGSDLAVRYLSVADCEDLRRRVLAGAAQQRAAPVHAPGWSEIPGPAHQPGSAYQQGQPFSQGQPEHGDRAGAPEQEILLDGPLPPSRLAGSVLLRSLPIVVPGVVGFVLVVVLTTSASRLFVSDNSPAFMVAVVAALMAGSMLMFVVMTVPVARMWSAWKTFHGFTLTDDPHSGRLFVKAGLTTTRRQTIPLRRIHALQLTEPFLWRQAGWSRLDSTIAGYGEKPGAVSTTLLPVAPNERADAIVDRILAEMTRGAGRQVEAQWGSPQRARWVSPVDWRQQIVTVTPRALVLRSGRFTRQRVEVPWARIQGYTVVVGPIARRLQLVSVVINLVPGPVSAVAVELDPADAAQLISWLQARRVA